MHRLTSFSSGLCAACALLCSGLRYLLIFLKALLTPRTVLAARILAAESQLALCRERLSQKKDPRPRFTPAFRILWVLLPRLLHGWQDAAQLMQPATVVRWHRQFVRLRWRWISRRRSGRPLVAAEMRELIRKLSTENPLWSAMNQIPLRGNGSRWTSRIRQTPCNADHRTVAP